jgi:outer membrane receptor protein involved in Fe transport
MRYSPIKDVVLRGSYGTGFLPPSISQIVSSAPVNFDIFASDPKRGGGAPQIINTSLIFSGNPNLRPERSHSLSLGAILQPRFIENLRLSVDYTRIKKTDEIQSLDPQTILNL